MSEMALLLITLVIKAFAYFFVIRMGILALQGPVDRVTARAIPLVAVRLLLGLAFAVPLWLFSSELSEALGDSIKAEYVSYVVVYGVIRWIVWSIVAKWVVPQPYEGPNILLGFSPADRFWRLSAVAVSFACDLPLWLIYGGPVVGKFFC